MRTRRYAKDVRSLALRALAAGATQRSWGVVAWDIAGPCERPYVTTIEGRPEWKHRKMVTIDSMAGNNRPMTVELSTPCRVCEPCLRKRRRQWTFRAATETAQSERTWLATFTIRPDEHYKFGIRARAKFGIGWDELTDDRKFRLVDRQIWSELSLWLKRLRARHDAPLRHFTVCEKHKSGFPHYHMLVHQMSPQSLTYRQLDGDWPHGFTNFKLVEDVKQAAYVAKYCSKSNLARVRASVAYGGAETPPDDSPK